MPEFKTYEPSFLDEQIELVNNATKNWKNWNYPSKQQLEQTYSAENFTGDTRHYVFENDTLIGFVSSAVENEQDGVQYGSIQYPFTKTGHEHLQDKLMEHSLKVLKEKNVKVVRTVLRDGWGDVDRFVEKYGYVRKDTVGKFAELNIQELNYQSQGVPNLLDLTKTENLERYEPQLLKIFAEENNTTEEQIQTILDTWKEEENNVAANIIGIDNGEVLAHAMAIKLPNNPDQAALFHVSVYKEGEEALRPLIFKQLINSLKSKGFTKGTLNISNQNYEEGKGYEELNLDLASTVQFEKSLNL